MGKCRHSRSCRYYCQVTHSCDYLVMTGSRRPCPADKCKGYRKSTQRRTTGLALEGSKHFDSKKKAATV